MPSKPVVAIDWDGVCVRRAWPAMGDWMPAAIESLTKLSHHYTVTIHTSRLAATWPDGSERRADEIAEQAQLIRAKLDEAGLTMVRIHPAAAGKPHAEMYVDDRGFRFLAERRSRQSWEALTDRLLTAVGKEA